MFKDETACHWYCTKAAIGLNKDRISPLVPDTRPHNGELPAQFTHDYEGSMGYFQGLRKDNRNISYFYKAIAVVKHGKVSCSLFET